MSLYTKYLIDRNVDERCLGQLSRSPHPEDGRALPSISVTLYLRNMRCSVQGLQHTRAVR